MRSRSSTEQLLDQLVYQELIPVTLGLAVLYALFAIFYLLILPAGIKIPLACKALFSSAILFGMYRMTVTRRLRVDQAQLAVFLICVLTLVDTAIHIHVEGNPRETTNLIFLLIGAPCILPAFRWIFPIVVGAWVSWLSIAIKAGFDSAWQHQGVALIISSIFSFLILSLRTREIRAAEYMNRTLEKQRQAMAYSARLSSLGEMAGGVSHEINNPLTSIIGRADLLRRMIEVGKSDDEKAKSFLNQIVNDGLRIKKIIASLRLFSRDVGNDPFVVVRVADLLDEVSDLVRERFKSHRIKLDLSDVPETVTVDCHPSQILQILVNLLNNAFDAVNDLKTEDRWVAVTVKNSSDKIKIIVEDSGPGIPFEIRDKIMDPFFTTKGPQHGTGIGLSISRSLAESNGGQLVYIPAKHTHFELIVPKTQKSTFRKSA